MDAAHRHAATGHMAGGGRACGHMAGGGRADGRMAGGGRADGRMAGGGRADGHMAGGGRAGGHMAGRVGGRVCGCTTRSLLRAPSWDGRCVRCAACGHCDYAARAHVLRGLHAWHAASGALAWRLVPTPHPAPRRHASHTARQSLNCSGAISSYESSTSAGRYRRSSLARAACRSTRFRRRYSAHDVTCRMRCYCAHDVPCTIVPAISNHTW